MINHILQHWGIYRIDDMQVTGRADTEPHVWLINNQYCLKCVDNADIVENINTISEVLLTSGLPAAIPIKTASGNIYVIENGKTYFLSPMLSGKPLENYREYDWRKFGTLVGHALAHFHNAIEKCRNDLINIGESDFYKWVIEWAVPTIQTNLPSEEAKAVLTLYDDYTMVFPALYYNMPRQLIHNDFHCVNILFEGEVLSGFVDLDSCTVDVRVSDIVMFAGYLLWKMRDEREAWLPALSAVLQGYQSINALTTDEIDGMFYKFYSLGLVCIAAFTGDKGKIALETTKWLIDQRDRIDSYIRPK